MTSEAQAFAAALATKLGSKAEKADDMLRGWTIEAKIGRVYWFLRFNDNAGAGGIDFRYEADEVEVFGAITKTAKGFVWEVEAVESNNCHPSTLQTVVTHLAEITIASRDC